MFGGNSRIAERALGDLAEHIRFGKFFRTDDDWIGHCEYCREKDDRRDQQETASSKSPTRGGGLETAALCLRANERHKFTTLRCALINSETKLLAGLSRRSAIEPL